MNDTTSVCGEQADAEATEETRQGLNAPRRANLPGRTRSRRPTRGIHLLRTLPNRKLLTARRQGVDPLTVRRERLLSHSVFSI